MSNVTQQTFDFAYTDSYPSAHVFNALSSGVTAPILGEDICYLLEAANTRFQHAHAAAYSTVLNGNIIPDFVNLAANRINDSLRTNSGEYCWFSSTAWESQLIPDGWLPASPDSTSGIKWASILYPTYASFYGVSGSNLSDVLRSSGDQILKEHTRALWRALWRMRYYALNGVAMSSSYAHVNFVVELSDLDTPSEHPTPSLVYDHVSEVGIQYAAEAGWYWSKRFCVKQTMTTNLWYYVPSSDDYYYVNYAKRFAVLKVVRKKRNWTTGSVTETVKYVFYNWDGWRTAALSTILDLAGITDDVTNPPERTSDLMNQMTAAAGSESYCIWEDQLTVTMVAGVFLMSIDSMPAWGSVYNV